MKYSFAIIAILCAGLSGCGNIQIPSSSMPRDINTPPVRATQSGNVTRSASGQSDASFVGASAVKVGPGDTVYALSRRHRVPVQAIIRANDLRPPYLLNVGQRIELPRGTQHTVTPGDTLYSVAQRYDVVMYELARLNGIDAPYTIRVGEVLVIPSDDKPPKSVSSPPVQSAAAPPPAEKPRRMVRVPQAPRGTTSGTSSGAVGQIAVVPPKKPPEPVPPPVARTGRGFVWPVKGPLMSNFGTKDGGLRNDGINIIAPKGTPVRAAENGVVAYAGNEIRGFGNLLLIKHADGYVTAYAHNADLLVKRGQRVSRGQKIATVGQSGSVNRPQLHFEIRKGRRPQNPEKYLRGA
ncbi:LysM peptidoglycan-binding domain-containing M23 family metallopeptidase [Thalassospiraceae bacterium LMO-JJ14]|nr:LysM peptidoglycan-binding domain-containing M23 family metallopeptidase [Thalassospiraceae bacterium LMO-JJ14]